MIKKFGVIIMEHIIEIRDLNRNLLSILSYSRIKIQVQVSLNFKNRVTHLNHEFYKSCQYLYEIAVKSLNSGYRWFIHKRYHLQPLLNNVYEQKLYY